MVEVRMAHAIHVERLPRLARHIERLGRTHLHAECQLEGLDHAFNLGVARDTFHQALVHTLHVIQAVSLGVCVDVRVNQVTPVLFGRWPGPADLAGASTMDIEEVIRSTGMFRQKARSLRQAARMVVTEHGGMIEADDRKERGARFRVVLPVDAAVERGGRS